MKDAPGRNSLRSRLGWFAVLYLGGVLAAFMLAAAFHVLLSAQQTTSRPSLLGRMIATVVPTRSSGM